MRLTAFSDYTLRVLIYLALHRDRLATIQNIADGYGISENHLMKVVHHLSKAGIIESTRGKGGGIRLAHEPDDIRLGGIVRDAEGDGPIVECMGKHNQCRIARSCALTGILVGAFDALYEYLDRYTLADLTQRQSPLRKQLNIQPLLRAHREKAV